MIALLLVNVVWELHSTIRVKSLWIFFSQVSNFIMQSTVKIKGMYSTKTGKTFDGVVLLADTGGKYVNFRVEQNRK